jgi:hypothetical protein
MILLATFAFPFICYGGFLFLLLADIGQRRAPVTASKAPEIEPVP